ncbi:TPA: spore coat protein [candidate division CPR2 bacterium]|uniref:glucose-1-phosphate thymidylyltransferase n=1 Tax=candidate division CPR2 bacterium GW2011_GWC1_41_48 TaxID=1618344 RepID=A0A0G0Z6K2_UNCC2|nr:MAG: Glucose-1-phosphate thymidylyltransferase [candidate division CPR2 bacterium GW2011_GWC2_39_35]KKR28760.1 MAG: Glucose-1-phosphate thymidylyltransferase [candidate division CPR2 bacterium GW2011_GWD2_39_7]KKS08653.1 MAG: Glucose-1-phosphate thymidylyltransferase [candidate division CPR2 bacterium GW2011_GWC1_41_48]OGB73149.1 MAG: spore coat protein [candidate division CPR2 bacterium GWD2_39_7]HBG81397.1 spore coat protein [candidate division CPR2 bacterium]
MKGIIAAGGHATRLRPLTLVTNKHMLPIYNKPMIYYPIKALTDMGITDILIVSGKGHGGNFLELLGSGREFGAKFTYEVQEKPGGIAEVLALAEDFVDGEDVVLHLGDNLFEDDFISSLEDYKKQGKGAKIFLKKVHDPERFGVAEVKGNKVLNIVEKPKVPKTNYAVTGLYMYDNRVFDIVKTLRPSDRGELEITDVNNAYIAEGTMSWEEVKGWWTDAGTFDSLLKSNLLAAKKDGKNNVDIFKMLKHEFQDMQAMMSELAEAMEDQIEGAVK